MKLIVSLISPSRLGRGRHVNAIYALCEMVSAAPTEVSCAEGSELRAVGKAGSVARTVHGGHSA